MNQNTSTHRHNGADGNAMLYTDPSIPKAHGVNQHCKTESHRLFERLEAGLCLGHRLEWFQHPVIEPMKESIAHIERLDDADGGDDLFHKGRRLAVQWTSGLSGTI